MKNFRKHEDNQDKPTPKWVEKLFGLIHHCWQYHAPCSHINMQAVYNAEMRCWDIKTAPVFQEVYGGDDDGKKVWAGFIFDIGEFSQAPGVWVQAHAASSFCVECSPTPKIMLRGKFQGHAFFLHVNLEPIEETQTVEILDTIKHEIRDMPEPPKDE